MTYLTSGETVVDKIARLFFFFFFFFFSAIATHLCICSQTKLVDAAISSALIHQLALKATFAPSCSTG
jgi:hypothetical protein